MRHIGIILIGGQGLRFGSSIPKQFQLLAGKELYKHTLLTFEKSGLFDEILMVSPDGPVQGGATRQASCFNALQACPSDTDIVLIHDGVRPFVTKEILQENLEKAAQHGAVNTVIPCRDTIISVNDSTITAIPERSSLRRGQTPQTFSYSLILEAHKKALEEGITDASDDCQLVHRLGHPVHLVEGSEENIKITTPQDLLLAEQIIAKKEPTLR